MHDFHFPHLNLLTLSSVQSQAYILDVHVCCMTSENFRCTGHAGTSIDRGKCRLTIVHAPVFFFFFFFVQDIYYSNYTELIKKKVTTKFLTTVITEGEKKGKVLRTYNYLHFTVISLQPKNGRAIAECGLFYK